MKTMLRRAGRRLCAGFTLIELLAVILIISILVAALTPMVNDAIESAKVSACQANLREIHKGMILYNIQFKESPNESGVKFFAQLISRRAIENSKKNAERLTCPSIQKSALAIGELPWDEWWTDLELIDGDYSAYAGRDFKNHPLRRFPPPASEALVADDNDPTMNHRVETNVLFGDGSVEPFHVGKLIEDGILDPEEELLIVGPDSPIEALQKLSLN